MNIDRFHGKYSFLSNFYPAPVELSGELYPTVEHAYQAAKSDSVTVKRQFLALRTPQEAKKMGRTVKLRSDWDSIRLAVMKRLVTQKFTYYPDLRQLLIGTGKAELIEGNNWHDHFWGVDWRVPERGQNHLRKILMEIRTSINAKS